MLLSSCLTTTVPFTTATIYKDILSLARAQKPLLPPYYYLKTTYADYLASLARRSLSLVVASFAKDISTNHVRTR